MNDILSFAENSAVICLRSQRPIFRFSGKDAERYLHGRLTQSIKGLRSGEATRSLVLTPQGRIQGVLSILREELSYLILGDPCETPEERANLLRAILQFKVADDVQVEDLSEKLSTVELLGSFSKALKNQLGENIPSFDLPMGELSRMIFLSEDQALFQTIQERTSARHIEESEFQLLRICANVPEYGKDLSEKILGPEIDVTPFVSFQKGCYAGQEVVEMATARGRPNKRLVQLSAKGLLPASTLGAEICNEAGVVIGSISSLAYSPRTSSSHLLGFLKTAEIENGKTYKTGETLLSLV